MKFIIILLTFTSTLSFAHLSEEQQAKITNITALDLNNTSNEQSPPAEIPSVKTKNIPILFPEESSPENQKETASAAADEAKLESGSVVVENKVQKNETEIEAGKKRQCNKTETDGGKHKLGWRPYRDCDYDDYDYPNYPYNPYPYPYPLPLPLLPPFGDACQFDYQCTAILKRTDGICARIPGKPNMCACPFGYRMVSNSYLGAVMGCQPWENCDNDCQFDASLGIDSNMFCDYDTMRCACRYYYSSNGWRCE